MIIKEKLKPSANQAFIIFSMLWIVLFVWYGPELGILSVGGKLDLELQNIYLVIYSICAFSFTFLFKAEDYIIASKIGTVGTLAGFIMVISDAFPLFTLIGVIVMAVFSSAFSMGIFYLYLYVLTSKEQQQTAVFIIAVNAVSQFISSIGLSDMQDPIYNTLSIILLVMIFMCTMGLKKVNYNIQYQTKNKQVPGIALYGALLIVVTVQFLNGVAVIVLHYRSFNEASGYMFFYAGQFLAAVMAYILIVKMSLKIMDLFYIYFFSVVCGFVLIIASKSGGLNFINIGVVFLGYCEIGTIFEWLITASICKKYREIWVLRRVLFAFAFSALAVAVAGTLLVKQTQDVFYILAASVSLLLVSVIFILVPLFNRLHRELSSNGTLSWENDRHVGNNAEAAIAEPKQTTEETGIIDTLTKREKEITQLLLEGYTAPQIAAILEIKLNTAKVHIRNVYEKLEVNSRPELFIRYGGRI